MKKIVILFLFIVSVPLIGQDFVEHILEKSMAGHQIEAFDFDGDDDLDIAAMGKDTLHIWVNDGESYSLSEEITYNHKKN